MVRYSWEILNLLTVSLEGVKTHFVQKMWRVLLLETVSGGIFGLDSGSNTSPWRPVHSNSWWNGVGRRFRILLFGIMLKMISDFLSKKNKMFNFPQKIHFYISMVTFSLSQFSTTRKLSFYPDITYITPNQHHLIHIFVFFRFFRIWFCNFIFRSHLFIFILLINSMTFDTSL